MFGLLVKLLLFYLAIKVAWSIFSKGNRIQNSQRTKPKESVGRYQSEGETIEDADYEEVK